MKKILTLISFIFWMGLAGTVYAASYPISWNTSTTSSLTSSSFITPGLLFGNVQSAQLGNSLNGGNLAPLGFGPSTPPYPFPYTYPLLQTSANVDTATYGYGNFAGGITVANTGVGPYDAVPIVFENGGTTFAGVNTTDFAALTFSGSGWSAFSGLPPNSLAMSASDGSLVFDAASTNPATSTMCWGIGPGYAVGNCDMVLKNLTGSYTGSGQDSGLGIGSTTPDAHLSVETQSTASYPALDVSSVTGTGTPTSEFLISQTGNEYVNGNFIFSSNNNHSFSVATTSGSGKSLSFIGAAGGMNGNGGSFSMSSGAAGSSTVAGTYYAGGQFNFLTGNGGDDLTAGNPTFQTAGQGGSAFFTSGNGGNAGNSTGLIVQGGAGGSFIFTSGTGGYSTTRGSAITQNGAGGAFGLTSGNGGIGTVSDSPGGTGGAFSLTAGNGGVGGAGYAGGGGAGVTITGGAGGGSTVSTSTAVDTGGDSGVVSIVGAQGGGAVSAATTTGGAGSDITFTAGKGGLANNGTLTTAGRGGNISLTAGQGGNVSGGTTNVGKNGGYLSLLGGAGSSLTGLTNSGGNVYVAGGAGSPSGSAGNVLLGELQSGSAQGLVGVGTTTPYEPLTVVGTSTADCFALNSSPNTCITGGGGTNYFTNSGATTTLNTGTVVQATTGNFGAIYGTSTTATSTFIIASTTNLYLPSFLNGFNANGVPFVSYNTGQVLNNPNNFNWDNGSLVLNLANLFVSGETNLHGEINLSNGVGSTGQLLISGASGQASWTSTPTFTSASTTNFAITGLANTVLAVNGNGSVIATTTGGGGGGSGTVNSGTTGQTAYYASSGTTVSGTSTMTFDAGNVVTTDATAGYTEPTASISDKGWVGTDFHDGPLTYMTVALNRDPTTGVFFNTARTGPQINLDDTTNDSHIELYTSTSANTTGSIGLSLHGSGQIFLPRIASGGQSNALCYNSSTGEVTENAGVTTCLVSSERFKQNILSLDASSSLAEVMALNPVQYTLKTDASNTPQVGLIAEQVGTVDTRLVDKDPKTGLDTGVNYQQFTAILTGAIQVIEKQVVSIIANITGLQNQLNQQQVEINTLNARLTAAGIK